MDTEHSRGMMRTRVWSGALLFAGMAACAPAGPAVAPPVAPAAAGLAAAEATISATDVYNRIAFLASDEMRGRDTPSPELERAAQYLAEEFRGMGLQPAGDPGSFIQRWPYRQRAMDAATVRLTAETRQGTPAMAYARDFFAVPAASDSVAGVPVFVGNISRVMGGFPADVADRIAVVAIGVNLGGEIIQVSRLAAQAGARGLLFVLHPMHTAPVVEQVAAQISGFGLEVPVPTFGVRYENAQAIVRAAGLDPAMLADTAHARPVVLTGATLRMFAPLTRTETAVPNVVAVLPGRDAALRDEYVVLTAHFDHVGVGQPDAQGDSIYNGADDNASGTAVMLEVAQAMAALPESLRPRRSVMFLGVSGEEKGLLGSLHFSDNPTVPIERIVANINMDMVGRNEPTELVAVGQEYSSLGPLAHRVARENPALRLTLMEDPDPAEQVFFRSDHVAFVRRDIPSIFFTTWLHIDYHRPSDTVEKIDTDKTARVARFVFRLTHEVADAAERPYWLEGRLEEVREILRASPF
jgi:Zn-dependent M28 family amino/carboxypeptidase